MPSNSFELAVATDLVETMIIGRLEWWIFSNHGNQTWKANIKGWEHPVVMDRNGKATTTLKPEEEWYKEEDGLALGNSRALNALFNGVDNNMFRLISTCTVAKDAWEILQTTHEGTYKVQMSRLQLLTTKFEISG